MLIVHAQLTIDLPYISSLKGRRKILHSLKERLKKRNIAVADLSPEYAKEAILALLFFASSETDANDRIEKLRNLLDSSFPDIDYSLQYEII